MRAFDRLINIFDQLNTVRILLDEVGIGFKPIRRGNPQLKAKLMRSMDKRSAHIIAIPNPSHCFAFDATTVLYKGLDVG